MPDSQYFFAESELQELTLGLSCSVDSKDSAMELIAAVSSSLVSEPGDQMIGSLTRMLSRQSLLQLLVAGFSPDAVISKLEKHDATELENRFGKLWDTLEDCRQRWVPRLSQSAVKNSLAASRALGLTLVMPEDNLWPRGLDELRDSSPPVLFVEGNKACLSNLSGGKSIVGSRSATSYGKKVTEVLVQELSRLGHATVSGGALGIDQAVHEASIKEGIETVAVMAGGLDRKYPRANFELFGEITKNGAIISERAPGFAPSRWRFLQRNRLIAALTPETIVVEAGTKSGSISTANHALELGRELSAVPGPIFSSTSSGTNALIAEGKAKCWLPRQSRSPDRTSKEGALASRAADAIRELNIASESEIQKIAGLTKLELQMALQELNEKGLIQLIPASFDKWHYALNHGG